MPQSTLRFAVYGPSHQPSSAPAAARNASFNSARSSFPEPGRRLSAAIVSSPQGILKNDGNSSPHLQYCWSPPTGRKISSARLQSRGDFTEVLSPWQLRTEPGPPADGRQYWKRDEKTKEFRRERRESERSQRCERRRLETLHECEVRCFGWRMETATGVSQFDASLC